MSVARTSVSLRKGFLPRIGSTERLRLMLASSRMCDHCGGVLFGVYFLLLVASNRLYVHTKSREKFAETHNALSQTHHATLDARLRFVSTTFYRPYRAPMYDDHNAGLRSTPLHPALVYAGLSGLWSKPPTMVSTLQSRILNLKSDKLIPKITLLLVPERIAIMEII